MTVLLQLLVNGLANGALLALLALAFGLVHRTLRAFHVALGAVYVVAAYSLIFVARDLDLGPIAAATTALLVGAGAGLLLELVLYRPFADRRTGTGATLIASLGAYLVAESLVAVLFGSEVATIPRSSREGFVLGPVVVADTQILQVVVAAAMVGAFAVWVRSSATARALWAMGDNPALVGILGLPRRRLRALAAGLSGLFAGAAAILQTVDVGIEPHRGLSAFLAAAVAVIVGGSDRYAGWVAGALLVAMMQSLALWRLSGAWTDAVTFTTLIVVLLVRRDGVVSVARRLEET